MSAEGQLTLTLFLLLKKGNSYSCKCPLSSKAQGGRGKKKKTNKLVIQSQSGLHGKSLPQKNYFLIKREKLFRAHSKSHHRSVGDGKPKALVHTTTSWQ